MNNHLKITKVESTNINMNYLNLNNKSSNNYASEKIFYEELKKQLEQSKTEIKQRIRTPKEK